MSGAAPTASVTLGVPGSVTQVIAIFDLLPVGDARIGDYLGLLAKGQDFYSHDPFVWNAGAGKDARLHVEINGTTVTTTAVSAFSPSPWVTLTGTIDAGGAFTATGSGTVAGRPNVPVKATCSISGQTFACSTIEVGDANGASLPNGSIKYGFSGTKQ